MKKIILIISCLFVTRAQASCDCWMDSPNNVSNYSHTETEEERRIRVEKYNEKLKQNDKLPLHRAIQRCDLQEVARLCAMNVDVNMKNAIDKETPLCLAIRHYRWRDLIKKNDLLEIIKTLLAHPHINPNMCAPYNDDYHEVTPLILACDAGNVLIVKELLSHNKINVNATPYKIPYEYYAPATALSTALYRYRMDNKTSRRTILELLLNHADINPNIGSLLNNAIKAGDTQNVKLLVAHPHTQLNLVKKVDYQSPAITPVELAHSLGNKSYVTYILDAYEQSKKAAIFILMAHHKRAGVNSPARVIPAQTLKGFAYFVLRNKPCNSFKMKEYREYANSYACSIQ